MISIRETYAGKKIFLVGASGFLGKVWLTQLLDQIPDIGKIYILLRRKGLKSAHDRFIAMINSSYAFQPLHDKHGANLSSFLDQKTEVLEGDLSEPRFGLEQHYPEVDLVVNSAGLVEFNPDIRDAVSANVDGTLNAAEYAKTVGAKLLHISTCYVAGLRQGEIDEAIFGPPNGVPFDAEREYADLHASILKIVRDETKSAKGSAQRRQIRQAMIAEGMNRAEEWGWTNTYTYTKGLAELLLQQKYPTLRFSLLRPSIIESSLRYPFPGWNEGFNTSGPLAYLLGTWFKYLPAKKGNPFDVVPVDLACNGITLAGAALLNNIHHPVYQCATSHRNLFTIERACELTSLSHRTHLRLHGDTRWKRKVLSRWETVPSRRDHLFSIPNLRRLAKTAHHVSRRVPGAKKLKETTRKWERKLEQIEKTLDLFLPFIHDNYQIFKTDCLSNFPLLEDEFRFEPEAIHWRDYWLNVQMPGLRRWSFPAIQGKQPEQLKPEYPVTMNGATP